MKTSNEPFLQGLCEIGLLGLGLLSRNLLGAVTRHGHLAAGWDPDPARSRALNAASPGESAVAAGSLEEFVGLLRRPRVVMMILAGGPGLDRVLRELRDCLDEGDLVLDGGAYHHTFTPLRRKLLAERGIHYIPVGFAFAGEGLCYGCSSLFPTLIEACRRVKPLFEGTALATPGEPCVTFMADRVNHCLGLIHDGKMSRHVAARA